MANGDGLLIYGKHSVLSALKNRNRDFIKIYTSNIRKLNDFLEDNGISVKNIVEYKNNGELNNFLGENINHQGYVARVSERKRLTIDDFILKECKDKRNLPRLLILDQLTDPHNVGAIIRTAVAFGVNYIIMTKYNSPKDSPVIAKSSAGMSEIINMVEVVNVNQTIEILKNTGYFVIGLAGEAKNDIKSITDNKNLCLVVGNEGNGLRPLVKRNCDILYRISMQNNVESLNVSVASAIAMYQLWS
ncbi:MAG: 23S rRNA (guanosine(2251)-2'-O)-methyltransferase RlmB [Rickettsiales bacterium]|jgi:predicted rRNA methylase|nr:23S rRNA (guanosine(2251)-2'-O)-methyltransferase RlmB [Rickettsiales bacterium]